jgi:hypothetical protein
MKLILMIKCERKRQEIIFLISPGADCLKVQYNFAISDRVAFDETQPKK